MAHKDPVIRKAYFKNYNIDRKEETAVFNKAYRANHPELKQANAAWQKANSGQRAISQKKYRKENATEINQRARIKQKLLRLEVIAAMGGCCKCCGEKEPEFLVIDHVHGGGTKERKQGVGKKLYYHVKKLGYPPEYQLLCHNCNFSKWKGGVCVHQRIHIGPDSLSGTRADGATG